jgi:hypothetical protein
VSVLATVSPQRFDWPDSAVAIAAAAQVGGDAFKVIAAKILRN